jgi:hypothetical protein
MAGDIRGEGAAILQQLWDALGWPEDVAEQAGVVTRYGVRLRPSSPSRISSLSAEISDVAKSTRQPRRQSLRQSPRFAPKHGRADPLQHDCFTIPRTPALRRY